MKSSFLAFVFIIYATSSQASLILNVDLSDFFDNDPLTNNLIFSGIIDAFPETTVTDNNNFPQLDLRNFFNSPRTGSGETSAISEGLSDYNGNTYGQLFLSGNFMTPEVEIPTTSIGLLATNRLHHDFDVNQVALTGLSIFDLAGMDFLASNFGSGGDVFAQDFPFVKIGQWQALSGTPVPLPSAFFLFISSLLGITQFAKRKNI